jgi:hypothetical protein
VNGQIKYNLSDLHYPFQHSTIVASDFQRKWGQCYTITPDDAIEERLARLGKEGTKLNVILPKNNIEKPIHIFQPSTLDKLHRMLADNHPMAKTYRYVAEEYAKMKCQCEEEGTEMPRFRMTLLSKKKAVEEGYSLDEGIHDHRVLVPTQEGMMQCATVSLLI